MGREERATPWVRVLPAAYQVHSWVAMELMRHSQSSLTMEIYRHVIEDAQREAVDMIGQMLRA